ncbi:MAG: DUF5658 family protein [Rubripirellula sp.]
MQRTHLQRSLTATAVIAILVVQGSVVCHGQANQNAGTVSPVSKNGYVFLNGNYIEPPYEVVLKEAGLIINGDHFSIDESTLPEFMRGGAGRQRGDASFMGNERLRFASAGFGGGRRRGGRPSSQSTFNRLQSFVSIAAKQDVTILLDGRKPLLLEVPGRGQTLLEVLLGEENNSTSESLSMLSDYDLETLEQLTSSFRLNEAFTTRATGHLDAMHKVQSESQSILQANVWSERIGYPLTIVAMVLVVLAFGHLLSNKPTLTDAVMEEFPKETKMVVGRSLMIVALLSIIDLVWTMAAAQAGSIRELNPLGSKLLHDPMQLIVFKFLVTSIAIGLLYRLKQQPIAQMASWWSCLVLTLLTARWLTFNSMFL